jgi:hypothetical protein
MAKHSCERPAGLPESSGNSEGTEPSLAELLTCMKELTLQVSRLASENQALKDVVQGHSSAPAPKRESGPTGDHARGRRIRSERPTVAPTGAKSERSSDTLAALDIWRDVEALQAEVLDGLPRSRPEVADALSRAMNKAVVLTALGTHAVLPFTEVLEACGISREVGDRLREEGAIEPILVNDSKNPRLYISVGAWRDFVKRRKLAPPPSRSKLSKAKRRTKAK